MTPASITPASIMAECPRVYAAGVSCGFGCPPGWLPLVRELSLNLEALCDEGELVIVEQVKSKFGGLRFYATCSADAQELIDAAETESYKICEICGAPGKPRGRGWIETLCEKCEGNG